MEELRIFATQTRVKFLKKRKETQTKKMFGTSNGEPIELRETTTEILQPSIEPPRPNLPRTSSKTKPTKAKTRYRGWCITDNNYDEQKIGDYKNISGCTYGIMGREVAPDTGTPHLQGYVYIKYNITLSAMKKRILTATGRKPNIRGAEGSAKQNRVYCSKEDQNPVEWGTIPKQGTRSDLIKLKEALDDPKMSIKQVWDDNFSAMVKYGKGAMKYRQILRKQASLDWRKVKVTLIKGPTGCGKTKMAMYDTSLHLIPDTFMIHGADLQWWDGYENQKRIVIDEYANQIKITDLIALLDGNQKRLNVKHSFEYAGWTSVIITTNLHELHENAKPSHRDALARRITCTVDMWSGVANTNSNARRIDSVGHANPNGNNNAS